MMQYKPTLIINKLILLDNLGNRLFEERFKHGINIVRGTNSSGKSTIANFLYFGLGGDFHNWTEAASQIQVVLIEIEIDNSPITLRRENITVSKQGMYIFWGTVDNSMKNLFDKWEFFPYQKTSTRVSYSNVLFNLMGFPEVKGEADNNLTMHQVLRLLYIDQISETQSFIRTENFDSAITRKTVEELLFGIYNNNLYFNRLLLISRKKEYEFERSKIKALKNILKEIDTETNLDILDQEIKKKYKDIEDINRQLEEIQAKNLKENKSESKLQIDGIQSNLSELKRKFSLLKNEILDLEFDIQDSIDFISSLIKRANSLNESISMREILEEIELKHCPICLTEIKLNDSNQICGLCKEQIDINTLSSQALRMKQEIDFQIKESQHLLLEKQSNLQRLKLEIKSNEEFMKLEQFKLNEYLGHNETSFSEAQASLLIEKGNLENSIKNLIKQKEAAIQVNDLFSKIDELSLNIKRLESEIQTQMQSQKSKYYIAQQSVQKFALEILAKDTGVQSEFRSNGEISFDFNLNNFGLNGKNNFSESSNIYLKNAIRFGIFFASLELDFFRYPRFVLCDNIEDKGMTEDRSHKFQEIIVDMSKRFDVDHQIIFTTSMISPDLDNEELCVGEKYYESNKTLKKID